MKVKLISITPDAEKTMMYCARVSNPDNQDSGNPKLLTYCINNGHWSIFEMANMVVEVQTSRAISAQILRHRSFSFQEFSQRYAKVQSFEVYPARRQDLKNRQNSIDDVAQQAQAWFENVQKIQHQHTQALYDEALEKGIAKEQARFLLPMSSTTKIYINGTVRSWIHYLRLRCGNGTQKEHRDIADAIKEIFVEQFPTVSEALEWKKN